MTENDFLQIFKTGFHKLKLIGVKKIKEHKNKNGKKYFEFLGKFVFIPPYQIWNNEPIDYDFLKSLLNKFEEETSNCITRKFTKKIIKDGQTVNKKVFKYVFDVVPKNVFSFSFDRKKKTMTLIVKGWGIYQ